jgi:hypothetical protein
VSGGIGDTGLVGPVDGEVVAGVEDDLITTSRVGEPSTEVFLRVEGRRRG